jgi:O-glycosyl hydrolase
MLKTLLAVGTALAAVFATPAFAGIAVTPSPYGIPVHESLSGTPVEISTNGSGMLVRYVANTTGVNAGGLQGTPVTTKGGFPGYTPRPDGTVPGGGGSGGVGPTINALAAYTTPNSLASGMNASTPAAFSTATATAARVVVDVTSVLPGQPWLGVGAAMTDSSAYVLTNYLSASQKDAALDDWFNPAKGNWTFMRVAIGDSDFVGHPGGQYAYKTYDDAADYSLAGFDASSDLNYIVPRIKEARAKNSNLRIIATPWTPPARYKSNGLLYGNNGIFVANVQNFTTYAQYIVKYLQFMQAQGIPIWAVSSQNEPNVSPVDYPGCIWNPVDLNNFNLNYLRPAMNAAGFNSVLIIGGDAAWADSGTFISSAVNTATFDIAGYHAYAQGGNTGAKNAPNGSIKAVNDGVVAANKPWIMTEMSSGTSSTVGPAVSDIVDYYAKALGVNSVLNGCSGIIFWNATLDQQNNPIHGVISNPLGGAAVTGGLVAVTRAQNNTGALTYNAEYWLLRHFSLVRIGARAVKTSLYGAGVMASAMHNPDNTTFVYLYNPTGNSITTTVTDAVGKRGTVITLAPGDQTSVVYPDPAAGVAAAASAVALVAVGGNAQTSLIVQASANGSPITGVDLYRGTSPGVYSSTPVATFGGSSDPFYTGSFSYNDTGETNGQGYFFLAVIKTAAGNTMTLEATATPSSSAPVAPAHYMSTTATGSAAFVGTTTNIPRDNYVDLACWTNLQTYTADASKTLPIAHTWASGTATGSNSGFLFGMDPSGKPTFLYFTVSKAFGNPVCTVSLNTVYTPGTGIGVWVRPIFNLNTTAVTSVLTPAGATSPYVAAPGSCAYFYSLDSTDGVNGTWNQLGTTITGLSTSSGLSVQGVPNVGHTGGADSIPIGKFYKVVLRNSTGVIWNPDFTVQATGTASFADTVASPNTWTLKTANGASIA